MTSSESDNKHKEKCSSEKDHISYKKDAVASLYSYDDLHTLNMTGNFVSATHTGLSSLDELLERDRLREKDGFPRKIRVGRLIKPGKSEKDSIIIVPTTVEEKFIHDSLPSSEQEDQMGGAGQGEEGEVIGEQPVRQQSGEGNDPGNGKGGQHEVESNAYELGKILTEKFELPNLKDKGTKRSFSKYTYDITDKNRGFGQILDKKSTLKRIINTNISLDIIKNGEVVDTGKLLISPSDRMYRILSREKDYESQALVFFIRDYSGSMDGKCSELVVSQHVMIYSWLLYQYAKRVETRFILHDTQAKEVPDFYNYYNSRVAGGTEVASAYKLVNEIVEKENLAKEYNIYIFHGTDGDDGDTRGEKAIPELTKMISYASRVGITIVEHSYASGQKTEVESYLEHSRILHDSSNLVKLDVFPEDADESRLIQGIKNLISFQQV
jgi:uncharacterized sporulation protein YeaH/YhbH (DUF444 family)